jgi:alpha-L-fucosidase 2
MEWQDAKLVKLVIKSTIGGNLRLRIANSMRLDNGGRLKKASGKNSNPFYQVEEIPAPIISDKATISPVSLKETVLYDLPTGAGKLYSLTAN